MKITQEIKVNIDIKKLKDIKKIARDVVGGGLRRGTMQAAKYSIPNAPILTGYLRSKIRASSVIVEGNSFKGVGGVETNDVPYAIKMHEGVYNLGPISRIQPNTPEGGVGRKFVSRVMDVHGKKDFLQDLKDYADSLFFGKKV